MCNKKGVKMARFDTPCMTFYVSAIVTKALYQFLPFASYLTFNNIVTLESRLEATQDH